MAKILRFIEDPFVIPAGPVMPTHGLVGTAGTIVIDEDTPTEELKIVLPKHCVEDGNY